MRRPTINTIWKRFPSATIVWGNAGAMASICHKYSIDSWNYRYKFIRDWDRGSIQRFWPTVGPRERPRVIKVASTFWSSCTSTSFKRSTKAAVFPKKSLKKCQPIWRRSTASSNNVWTKHGKCFPSAWRKSKSNGTEKCWSKLPRGQNKWPTFHVSTGKRIARRRRSRATMSNKSLGQRNNSPKSIRRKLQRTQCIDVWSMYSLNWTSSECDVSWIHLSHFEH